MRTPRIVRSSLSSRAVRSSADLAGRTFCQLSAPALRQAKAQPAGAWGESQIGNAMPQFEINALPLPPEIDWHNAPSPSARPTIEDHLDALEGDCSAADDHARCRNCGDRLRESRATFSDAYCSDECFYDAGEAAFAKPGRSNEGSAA